MESRVLHVTRLKTGLSTTHPLRGDEIRAIQLWLTERAKDVGLDAAIEERRAEGRIDDTSESTGAGLGGAR